MGDFSEFDASEILIENSSKSEVRVVASLGLLLYDKSPRLLRLPLPPSGKSCPCDLAYCRDVVVWTDRG
jgi:hypothetical protein